MRFCHMEVSVVNFYHINDNALYIHTQPIQTRVRAIFDVIVAFQQKQTSMYTDCLEEVDRRALIQQQMEERTEEVCLCVCVLRIYIGWLISYSVSVRRTCHHPP